MPRHTGPRKLSADCCAQRRQQLLCDVHFDIADELLDKPAGLFC
ncbi:hypothetical protein X769_13965 [Mesorhizobium sp. LSJC268A00]|nr:hypothetical protein X769_13965 [Mesorhizobium sp. LSJC268A00]